MKLENIEKLIKKFITTERIWRSNINGDFDYFTIKVNPGVKFKNIGYIHLTTSIGFCRYGNWNEFNIKIKDGSTKIEVLNAITEYVEYFHKCNRSADSYAQGFADYIEATGGHAGNPVYMD